jgi:hypothetical protein
VVAAHLGQRVEPQPHRVPEGRQPDPLVVLADVLEGMGDVGPQHPGERPGGCWGLSGSLTYTSAPLPPLPTQLVAVLGMP